MNVDVRTTADFDRSFHKLSKKYKSLRKDLQNFVEGLKNGSARGDEVIKGVFKYRLAITSKGSGKSGGARVITYEVSVIGEMKVITLLTIYDKSSQSSVLKSEIADLQKRAGLF